jgi:L-rhamnose mutarotase
MYNQYTQLHDNTWTEVMARMLKSNMRNFVVYYHEETGLMFHHFEYIGDDFEADMKACDDDPTIQRWWTYCEPCQNPFHWEGPPPSQQGKGGKGGEWWASMKCLNHCGGWPVAWTDAHGPPPGWVKNNPFGKESTSSSEPNHLQHNRPQ